MRRPGHRGNSRRETRTLCDGAKHIYNGRLQLDAHSPPERFCDKSELLPPLRFHPDCPDMYTADTRTRGRATLGVASTMLRRSKCPLPCCQESLTNDFTEPFRTKEETKLLPLASRMLVTMMAPRASSEDEDTGMATVLMGVGMGAPGNPIRAAVIGGNAGNARPGQP